ncbi:beach domain-containing protein lvsc [Anaeramoeba ignava]|uniref:Beach domain-containing protein lvsc n=1 Tax=Anaeramoeba ignava TaxID=1746090 RepID=A0A9Q0LKS4_ANAIG|nr:beach domain-containing protein lvsc [Anaeramoeba ignava]
MINIILNLYSQNFQKELDNSQNIQHDSINNNNEENENQSNISFLEILKIFNEISQKSIHNICCCCEAGIISFLLELVSKVKTIDIFKEIIQIVGNFAKFKTNVFEMKKYFTIMKNQLNKKSNKNFAKLMINELTKMKHQPNEQNPINLFDFYEQNSNIQLPPFNSSLIFEKFTFCCWIRIEEFSRSFFSSDPKEKEYKPRIFSLLSENNKGIELYFELDQDHKNQSKSISYRIYIDDEEMIEAVFPIQIETKKWYFFVFTQKYEESISEIDITIYINGKKEKFKKLQMKKQFETEEILTKNRIGSNVPFIRENKVQQQEMQQVLQLQQIKLLKQENEILQKENQSLKQENEFLKKQIQILNQKLKSQELTNEDQKEIQEKPKPSEFSSQETEFTRC